MKPILALIALTLLIAGGCANSTATRGAAAAKGNMVQVANDDAAMNAALAKGNATLPQFIEALKNRKASQTHFAVYARFTEKGQDEYLWIEPVALKGADFSGVVNNQPEILTQIKSGQTVTVPAKDVGDWMFVENGSLVGGQTSRVLRDQMSAAERADFDKNAPYKFN